MPATTSRHLWAGVRLVVLGAVDVAVFLVLARALRLSEVTTVVDTWFVGFPGAMTLLGLGDAGNRKGRGCLSTPGPATCSPTGTD